MEGRVLHVTIDNEQRRNALGVAMWDRLRQVFAGEAAAAGAACIVIAGSGDQAFCAGADINEFETQRANRAQVTHFHEEHVGPALRAIFASPLPTVARIHGTCFGGGLEIAACCDIRIGTPRALLGAQVARLGFPLAFGETEIMVRVFGVAVAAELLIEGRVLTGEEAQARGVLTRLVPPEELDAEIATTSERITAGSAYANRRMKEQFARLITDGSPISLDERLAFYDFADRPDYAEGYRAFLDKRRPRFTDR